MSQLVFDFILINSLFTITPIMEAISGAWEQSHENRCHT